MAPETKKLGALLVEAGLITPAQLQETLRWQRTSGERLGSALVSQGIISEESLMDFLAKQTGVPRLDVKNLEIPPAVLQKIPRRLAEQMNLLPIAFKEPKSLIVAMADPMDLNAVDSARFASGLNIEPVVASHTALRLAINEHYVRLTAGSLAVSGPSAEGPFHALPVPLEPPHTPALVIPSPGTNVEFPKDPFFIAPEEPSPFSFFTETAPVSAPTPASVPPLPSTRAQPAIIPQRSALAEHSPALDSYGNRSLIMGLIRLLQRRGILGEAELQRYLQNLAEAGEINPGD
jgi:hypothetical protein